MCGRYVRSRGVSGYLVQLELDGRQRIEYDQPSWNVRPGTQQPVIYPGGAVRMRRWGYLPAWAAARRLQPIITTQAEKLRGIWNGLARYGRVLVPGDQWYEWLPDAWGEKQPYAIGLKSGEPLWMAGLVNVGVDNEPRENDGYLIVTAPVAAGLLDVHGHRPVVFDERGARAWLEAGESVEAADALARNAGLGVDAFEYWPVSRDVNCPGECAVDAPYLIEPIEI